MNPTPRRVNTENPSSEHLTPIESATGLILCLGLNPALDVTYRIDRMVHGEAQRVSDVVERAGGKAANVARVAAQLGGRTHLLAALGGPAGATYADNLRASRLVATTVATTRHTRRTVTVVESDGTTTAFNEAGPAMPDQEWADVRAALDALLDSGDVRVLVLSGSVPPGAPETAYAECVAAASDRGVLTIVDVAGPPLLAALAAGASVVKPNRHELRATVGAEGIEGVQALRAQAPHAVVVASDGEAGLLCVGPDGAWRATPGRPLRGNPTGAGDALVAAIAVSLVDGRSWPEALRLAIGASGAAVLDPVAGHIDPRVAAELAAAATVEPIP